MYYYTWIFVTAVIFAFAVCFGIGSNDLANAFGTAYGARVLTIKQIVVIAAFCEFGGAILLGGQVAKTIGGDIAKSDRFEPEPFVFMYGMLCALTVVAVWLFVATIKKLPVSTTHSTVGGVIGFAVVFGGSDAINWAKSKDSFPYVAGVVPIFISWITSPVLSMVMAMATFWPIRKFVMRHRGNSLRRASITFAAITAFTFWVNAFFIFSKGMKNRIKWSTGQSAWVSVVIAFVAGCVTFLITPKLIEFAKRDKQKRGSASLPPVDETDEAITPPNAVGIEMTPSHDPYQQAASAGSSPVGRPRTATARSPSSCESLAGTASSPTTSPHTATTTNGSPGYPKQQERDSSSWRVTQTNLRMRKTTIPRDMREDNDEDADEDARSAQPNTPLVLPPSSPFNTTPEARVDYDERDRDLNDMDPSLTSPVQVVDMSPASPDGMHGNGNETGGGGLFKAVACQAEDRKIRKEMTIHNRPKVEEYDDIVEGLFKYLQIFTSIIISFAHGANDVSNSIGALAAIGHIFKNGAVASGADVELWMLALGGFGIVVGLAVLGHRIIVVLGDDMVTLSPCRGFSAQFATSLVVSLSSALGLPVSTTHCVTGAVIGIGLLEPVGGAIEWGVVGRTTAGWVITLIVTAVSAGVIFGQTMYAPRFA